jgi:hypothetical protein
VLHRIARVMLMGMLVTGFALVSTGGVAAQGGADLSISMTGPTRVKSQALVVYTITVTNVGTETATRVSIIGGGTDQFDSISMHCQNNGSFGQNACEPGDIAPGASAVATYSASVCCLVRHESRQAVIGASVGQDVVPDPDPDPANNVVQLAVYITGGQVK